MGGSHRRTHPVLMTVTLTGFMGCGKSSAGKALASRLGWEFVDLDEYITHKKGWSIEEIFANEGEEAFRAVEAECVRDIIIMHQIAGGDVVLALGGGTMATTSVQWLILGQTECLWLKASLPTCLERIASSEEKRPLLEGQTDVRKLFDEREKFYSMTDKVVNTEGLSVDEVADELLRRISK